MAEIFSLGGTKVRPGGYFNISKKGGNDTAGVVNGVTGVVFKSTFGPLNKAVEITAEEGYAHIFGTGLTTDIMQEAINGGAKSLIAVRIGKGGTQATVDLNDDSEETPAVKLTAKYPGDMELSVTIRAKLTDSTMKECIIYTGTTEFEKVEFAAGEGEAAALVAAFGASRNFTAQVEEGKDSEQLAAVSQKAFTAGTNPEATNEDYSSAFSLIEPYVINTICVDTEKTDVHILLQSFVDRIFNEGSFVQAVVAEKYTEGLETRQAHAAAFNDEKMHYVINAHVSKQGVEIDGYQTAASLAGMIGAVASNSSLTHTVINGFTELLEPLTNSQMVAAEKKGCLVLSYNSAKQVWIDNAINTLITPADNQDDGWKKIRRVKTRHEMMRRMNEAADNLAGKVDNDSNGRNTAISQLQSIGDAMIAEGKLISCAVALSETYKADGDSAWFDIDVVDKDSMEHLYLMYHFQFSTNA